MAVWNGIVSHRWAHVSRHLELAALGVFSGVGHVAALCVSLCWGMCLAVYMGHGRVSAWGGFPVTLETTMQPLGFGSEGGGRMDVRPASAVSRFTWRPGRF